MPRRYRNLLPPALLILTVTAGTTGCDREATRQRRAEEARRAQALEDGQRRKAETEPPTPEVQEQVRAASAAFMAEHHPTLLVEGTTFTPLTPNLFLVGVSVKDPQVGNSYVAQLSAERLREGDWGEGDEAKEASQLLWVVDYAAEDKMAVLAQRHGFAPEVERIRDQGRADGSRGSWGHRSWLDNYLIWHLLFNRPSSYGFRAGAGYTPRPPGYRFNDPGRPITGPDVQRFSAAAAPTGGRSMVFLGGNAWRPPLVSGAGAVSGQPFSAGRGGSVTSRGAFGSVSRGGFGGAGHASSFGG